MKKTIALVSILLASGLIGTAHAATPYVGVAGSFNRSEVDSGGFNASGVFNNTGSDTDNTFGASLIAGLGHVSEFAPGTSLRAELEGQWRGNQEYKTNSCLVGCGPGPLYYRTSEKSYGGFVNAYVDQELSGFLGRDNKGLPVALFVGGGVGLFEHRIHTNDSIVDGVNNEAKFSYNIGGGAKIGLSPTMELLLGARYVDLGDTTIPLQETGAPAGNFKLEHTAAEFRVGLNIALDALLP